MLFGAVGDLHGDFDALDRVMARHPEVAFWVCPGDLASDDGAYPRPRAPLYWIKGNNEDFDFVAGATRRRRYVAEPAFHSQWNLGAGAWSHARRSRRDVRSDGLRNPRRRSAAGLHGEEPRRRHFVHEEVEACNALRNVDIFLSHEAARPFPLPRVKDAGKTPINEVLSEMRPRLHLFGHHHIYTVAERQHVPSIGLEQVSRSYLLFDGKSLAHQRLTI